MGAHGAPMWYSCGVATTWQVTLVKCVRWECLLAPLLHHWPGLDAEEFVLNVLKLAPGEARFLDVLVLCGSIRSVIILGQPCLKLCPAILEFTS